jgi:hypothetical protein
MCPVRRSKRRIEEAVPTCLISIAKKREPQAGKYDNSSAQADRQDISHIVTSDALTHCGTALGGGNTNFQYELSVWRITFRRVA